MSKSLLMANRHSSLTGWALGYRGTPKTQPSGVHCLVGKMDKQVIIIITITNVFLSAYYTPGTVLI